MYAGGSSLGRVDPARWVYNILFRHTCKGEFLTCVWTGKIVVSSKLSLKKLSQVVHLCSKGKKIFKKILWLFFHRPKRKTGMIYSSIYLSNSPNLCWKYNVHIFFSQNTTANSFLWHPLLQSVSQKCFTLFDSKF